MTSRHWKELREKRDFSRQLKEFWEVTNLVADLDPLHEIERLYEEDCQNGLFDDDYWGLDDWDDWGSEYDDKEEDRYIRQRDRDYDYYDWDDDLDSPGFNDIKPLPGWHVRLHNETYLVLSDGKWANMLTGQVIYGLPWIDRENVIFGL